MTRLIAQRKQAGKLHLRATLDEKTMTLQINDDAPLTIDSPGLIPAQPLDQLSLGHDAKSAAGDYDAPNTFQGVIRQFSIR
ncbi:hypothetical protein [Blastopirellula retiformator]|uniref:Uncharacterized protein n=1 Tax=Blastopirellula retiformator TaxID=2527970 RepID=A0A5C5V3I5_9BACT|nr:hypothetical protein [Blastopirellula retiformator]TWT32580.1 hypothetical protein Enr8_23840 [Blastopirellula retiformator]